jgi:Protein of unknown function (DUF2442)
MLKDIVEARPLGQHRLFLRLEDGVEGELDFAEFLEFRGVFQALRDPADVCGSARRPGVGDDRVAERFWS